MISLGLAIYINKSFYLLTLLFAILIILLKFNQLELIIMENSPQKPDLSNKDSDHISAEDHPIVISARNRLNKN
jgi:hypothetical protein